MASNPEFLREGAAIADFKHPDRILVGAEEAEARAVLAEIYRPLFLNKAPLLFTNRRTAELTKYAANAFLAVKISFINEMATSARKSRRCSRWPDRTRQRIGASPPPDRVWRRLSEDTLPARTAKHAGSRTHHFDGRRSTIAARREWPIASATPWAEAWRASMSRSSA